MNISPPPVEELARLLSTHAHRHPQKAKITVPGDGGRPVVLAVLLGNPSGACRMPAGARPTGAWEKVVAATFGLCADGPEILQQLIADSVLWPDAGTLAQWQARWPALAVALRQPVRAKCGAALSQIEQPDLDEEPPPAIAETQAAAPEIAWRRLRPTRADVLAVAIAPPDPALWTLFQEAVKKPDAAVWQSVREMAEASVKACVRADGGAAPLAQILDRWPGLALLLVATVGQLAGAAAEVELGEW